MNWIHTPPQSKFELPFYTASLQAIDLIMQVFVVGDEYHITVYCGNREYPHPHHYTTLESAQRHCMALAYQMLNNAISELIH